MKSISVNLTMNNGEEINPQIIDFSRFNKMPVILNNHQYERPIGKATHISLDDSGLHIVPEFMGTVELEKYLNYLYDEGLLVAQPGGVLELDDNGNVKSFILHEISICHGMNPQIPIKS